MATQEKTEINYVAKDAIRRNNIRTEMRIQRLKWPMECGFYVDEYKKMYETLAKGRQLPPLPHKVPAQSHFRPFEPEPKNVRALPQSESHLHGWLYGGTAMYPTYRWCHVRKSPAFHRQMRWPPGSQY